MWYVSLFAHTLYLYLQPNVPSVVKKLSQFSARLIQAMDVVTFQVSQPVSNLLVITILGDSEFPKFLH